MDNSSWSSIRKIVFEDGVQYIGQNAFSSFRYLETVEIADSVKTIGRYAFDRCTSLKNVTIGNGVTTIKEWAFNMDGALTNLTIGKGLTTVEEAAFKDCTSLKQVNYGGTKKQWKSVSINNYLSLTTKPSLRRLLLPFLSLYSLGRFTFPSHHDRERVPQNG